MPTGATQQVYPMFTDSNSNGINDYFEQTTHDAGSYTRVSSGGYGHGWVDENGDGICDWAQNGSATWHGPGFVDTDGDGVCDYWQDNSPMHNQNGGMNFHDSNGNGVNDYMEEPWHMGYGHEFT
ncbi:MAG: hypothetical protein OEV92_01500, partial [Nitrospinota bacterium]|nr:hypothetical protein [Nitrospinota bacterium]